MVASFGIWKDAARKPWRRQKRSEPQKYTGSHERERKEKTSHPAVSNDCWLLFVGVFFCLALVVRIDLQQWPVQSRGTAFNGGGGLAAEKGFTGIKNEQNVEYRGNKLVLPPPTERKPREVYGTHLLDPWSARSSSYRWKTWPWWSWGLLVCVYLAFRFSRAWKAVEKFSVVNLHTALTLYLPVWIIAFWRCFFFFPFLW